MKSIVLSLVMVTLCSGVIMAQDIAVTVYNSNLGVVSETRSLEFEKGVSRLAFQDVPSQIDPASVRFSLVGGSGDIAILEQNYAFDLVDPYQMFRKYVDKDIELVDKNGNLYSGVLLASEDDMITLLEKSGKVKIVRMEEIVNVDFPALPEGLITRPTLFWLYSSDFAGKAECKVGYQTNGMTWSAEYVGVLDDKETTLNLSGWSSINNTSGKTYKDATLKLIAGDIHRAEIQIRGGRYAPDKMAFAESAAGFEEKAFFEYHMYTLPRRATLADNEIKQISLFEPAGTTTEKIFVYRPERNATQVEVAVKFMNSEKTGLGMPLPEGRVRIFKADTDGSLILLGEDRIDHTPKDEEVKLTVGYAFDITAEQKMLSQTRVTPKVEEQVFEVELANHKDTPVTVEVERKLYGFWDIVSTDIEAVKEDANTVKFDVPLKADETRTFRYTVRYNYR